MPRSSPSASNKAHSTSGRWREGGWLKVGLDIGSRISPQNEGEYDTIELQVKIRRPRTVLVTPNVRGLTASKERLP